MTMTSVLTHEHVTTGWEPDVPVDDTMLRQFVFNSADRNQHLAEQTGGTWRQWEDVCLADLQSPAAFGNQAILLCPLTDRTAGDVVARLRDGFAGTHVIFSAWPTPDLRPYGYALVGHPPFMVRPQGGAAPVRPPGLAVEEVANAAAMERYEKVFVEGYPVPELQPYSPGRLFGERLLGGIARVWVGSVDGRPVAAAMAINSRGLIAVENVATLPDARGHGYGGAVTATAALSAPDLPSALIASDDGRNVYERLGFLPISRFTLWVAA
jgi:GNAT superfamily N-acetyltransferase